MAGVLNGRSKKVNYPRGLNSVVDKIKSKMLIVRVTDIILNSNHPQFNIQGGWSSIGTIFYEENDLQGSNNNTIAKPFYPQTSAFPLVNELVLLFALPNKNIGSNTSNESYYYINMIGIWGSPHHNAYPNPVLPDTPSARQKDYSQTQAGSPVREIDEDGTGLNLNYTKYPSTLQDTFIERGDIHPLLPFAGDIMYQGRWGNSIRFGSTAKPTDLSALNDWSSTGENGDPITIIRNGQPTDVSPQGWIPITEKINNDLASIYQTSTQKIPIQVASENYNSYKTPPEIPSQYTKPQVIINSDRLVFNAKTDSVLLSAEKSVGLSSNDSLNFNSKNYIVAAGSIKLGSKDATEPLVKGETLYKNLTQVVDALITLVNVMEVQQLWPGGVPTPDGATSVTATSTKTILNNVKKDLVNIKSKVSKTV
mgnify:CR=1 FL=1